MELKDGIFYRCRASSRRIVVFSFYLFEFSFELVLPPLCSRRIVVFSFYLFKFSFELVLPPLC